MITLIDIIFHNLYCQIEFAIALAKSWVHVGTGVLHARARSKKRVDIAVCSVQVLQRLD